MDKTTIINVKGMQVDAWEEAKRAANKRGSTMGEWLSNACTQQANRERGDGIIQPGQGANPPVNPPLIHVDLREVAALIAAMATANIPVQKRVGAVVNRLLYAQLRAAEPERAGGLARIAHEPD